MLRQDILFIFYPDCQFRNTEVTHQFKENLMDKIPVLLLKIQCSTGFRSADIL
jgi:hypothetical protein